MANVCTDDKWDVNKTFGHGEKNEWKPWTYNDRVAAARNVKKFKATLSKKKLAAKTVRNKVTTYISENKSRQEFEPPIGRLIEKAHAEPLHLKNNACQLIHKLMLCEAIGKSALPPSVSKFSEVPSNSPFAKFIGILKSHCQLSRLAKKIIRWFNETKAAGKDFDYRFTGRDSRMFLHNFMFLVDSLSHKFDTNSQKFKLHVFAFIMRSRICSRIRPIKSVK